MRAVWPVVQLRDRHSSLGLQPRLFRRYGRRITTSRHTKPFPRIWYSARISARLSNNSQLILNRHLEHVPSAWQSESGLSLCSSNDRYPCFLPVTLSQKQAGCQLRQDRTAECDASSRRPKVLKIFGEARLRQRLSASFRVIGESVGGLSYPNG